MLAQFLVKSNFLTYSHMLDITEIWATRMYFIFMETFTDCLKFNLFWVFLSLPQCSLQDLAKCWYAVAEQTMLTDGKESMEL